MREGAWVAPRLYRCFGLKCSGGGGWSPIFSRPLNDWEVEEVERFLQAIHRRKVRPFQEDKLLLKASKVGGFSVKFLYKVLDQSPPLAFPCRSIWNPRVPPKLGFFA